LNEVSIKIIIAGIPEKPGIYQFFNQEGELLYIGKAKNLKKRVSTYFSKRLLLNRKLQTLVNKISDIRYVIVDTESDALLLENNLIKKYQPRYNVLLKDDKTFPWICIKNEPFPRVFVTRRIEKDGSEYFGPYTSGIMVNTLMDMVRKLYSLRTCSFTLSEVNIKVGKIKVCLEYHLGNCKGPCENFQSADDYIASIYQIREILKGNLTNIIEHLKTKMKLFAREYQFEKAEINKQKLMLLERFQSKSTIVSSRITNVDVYSIAEEERFACVNYFKVINGAIIQSHSIELVKKLDEIKEELLAFAIIEIRQRLKSDTKEIIIPFRIEPLFENLRITIPKSGEKRKLLDLSTRNALDYLKNRQQYRNNQEEKSRENIALEKLKSELRLKELPEYIECFDNSNIQGMYPVASCIVFKNGKPTKKEYRHFNIKSIKGPDDFASMEEIILRRYKRLLEEKQKLPQLIILDGGKGQLNAALKSLKVLGLRDKISIIAIAKRLEEILVPGDPYPIYLNKNSLSLKMIQFMRNEAHRFGLNFHRLKRSNAMIVSELDTIKGIGSKSKEKLLQFFGDIEKLKNSDIETLRKVVGKKLAGIIFNYFNRIESQEIGD
jgi:excinuclease ABC subunit C